MIVWLAAPDFYCGVGLFVEHFGVFLTTFLTEIVVIISRYINIQGSYC